MDYCSCKEHIVYSFVRRLHAGYEFLSSANGLVPGDLVFVLDRSNGESKAGARATHVAMVRKVENGKVYIYSHTPYSNGEWDTSAANTLFCHFKGIVI